MNERDRQFADAAEVVDDSLIMRSVVRAANAVRGATLSAFAKASADRRSFSGGWSGSACLVLAATGCLTHALLLQLLPERVTPVRPLAYLMVLAFAAFATVAGVITTRSNATAIADSTAGTANARKS